MRFSAHESTNKLLLNGKLKDSCSLKGGTKHISGTP